MKFSGIIYSYHFLAAASSGSHPFVMAANAPTLDMIGNKEDNMRSDKKNEPRPAVMMMDDAVPDWLGAGVAAIKNNGGGSGGIVASSTVETNYIGRTTKALIISNDHGELQNQKNGQSSLVALLPSTRDGATLLSSSSSFQGRSSSVRKHHGNDAANNDKAQEDESTTFTRLMATPLFVSVPSSPGWEEDQSNPAAAYQAVVVDRNLQGSSIPAWTQLGNDIDGAATYGQFAYSVSLSGNGLVLAAGAPYHDANKGRVRVYEYNPVSLAWSQLGPDIDGEASGDEFGSSVSLSDDGFVLAVAAPKNDGNGSNSGHVRVYIYNHLCSSWDKRGDDIDGEAAGDDSGRSISLSSDGGILAVGAPSNDGNGNIDPDSGHVRVYKYDNALNSWDKLGNDIDGGSYNVRSAESVSLSGNGDVLAVGAIQVNANGNTSTGRAQVFKYNNANNSWDQVGADIFGEGAYDNSGSSVSLSSDGGVLAVGARGNSGINGQYSGHVRVYKYNIASNSWNQVGADIDGEAASDSFGSSVSLSSDGGMVAVGAPFNDANGISNSGHVRVYKYNNGNNSWDQVGADIDGEAADDRSGWSVSLSNDGGVLAVGAYQADSNGLTNNGRVRVYSKPDLITASPSTSPTASPSASPSMITKAGKNNKKAKSSPKPTHAPISPAPTISVAPVKAKAAKKESKNIANLFN